MPKVSPAASIYFTGGGFTRGFTGKIHLARCFLRGRSVSGDKNKQTNSGTNKRTDGHRHRAEPSLLRRGFNKIQIKLNKLPCSLQHSDNKVTLSYNSKYWFLPRDDMHSADFAVARCPSVCPSVRPSVTRRYSIETAKLIVKRFSPSGSHSILDFPHQTVSQYSDRDLPITEASNARWHENRYFRRICRFISEMIQDRAIVTMKGV